MNSTDTDKFEFPYYKTSKNMSFKKGYPFTRLCFISTIKAIIAEYTLIKRGYNDGDKFHIIDSKNGNILITYEYSDSKGWVKKGE
ncbi:MAG: hypothetical protein GYA50_10180 [Eubacteriaceae bacterium]|nr:hypothetical protein [Eubacteriaceae bacterium]